MVLKRYAVLLASLHVFNATNHVLILRPRSRHTSFLYPLESFQTPLTELTDLYDEFTMLGKPESKNGVRFQKLNTRR
jgi:hypothetical protein